MASAARAQIPTFQKRYFMMRKSSTVIAMGLSMWLLVGCSSKPDAGDVKDGIVDGWKSCTFVKPYDVKKTNGLDRGNTYEMAISFKFEIVGEVPKGNPFQVAFPQGLNAAEQTEYQSLIGSTPPSAPNHDDASPEATAEYARTQQKREQAAALESKMAAARQPYVLAHQQAKEFYERNCLANGLLFWTMVKGAGRDPAALSKGDVIDIATTFNMIKSEKGWIVQ